MTTKLLEAHSIPVPPRLAGLLKQVLGRSGTGFDEGAFLQQLHYWTLNPETTGWMVEGIKWVYNSLKAWQAQFPWMTQYGLRKAIANLKKLGLIQTAQHWISQYKRVMFYRIDYERLNALAGVVCEQFARRGAEGDRIDEMTVRTSDTENTSDTSFPEQQTGVVLKTAVGIEDTCELPAPEIGSVEEMSGPGTRNLIPSSSGNNAEIQSEVFPELFAEVAQAVGSPDGASLPRSLRRAIAQYPERVRGAIAYLKHQQQKRQIGNSVGYLYEAIVSGWELAAPQAALAVSAKQQVPAGFKQWFEQARATGLILAATTIDGVHHTLHADRGWIATVELMQEQPDWQLPPPELRLA